MKVIISIGGRWKNNLKVYSLFEIYRERTVSTIQKLSKELKFKPPQQITIRPLYHKDDFPATWGMAIYDPFRGYIIAMSPECMNMRDKGRWVL